MHLVVDYFVTVNRATTMVTYDAGLISGLFLCMSRSQIVKAGCIFTFLEGG